MVSSPRRPIDSGIVAILVARSRAVEDALVRDVGDENVEGTGERAACGPISRVVPEAEPTTPCEVPELFHVALFGGGDVDTMRDLRPHRRELAGAVCGRDVNRRFGRDGLPSSAGRLRGMSHFPAN